MKLGKVVMTFLLGLPFLVSCTSGDSDVDTKEPAVTLTQPQYTPSEYVNDCLDTTIDAPSAIFVGEGLTAELQLLNRCDRPYTFNYGGYDLLVVSTTQKVVWRGSQYLPSPSILLTETLLPGEELIFRFEWNGKENGLVDTTPTEGEAVEPGAYKLVGTIDLEEGRIDISKPLEISE